MKNMKKFLAALLVLTMVLAMTSVAFAYKEKPLDEETYVRFKGNAYGYGKVTNNYGRNKSSVCLRKGSVAVAVAKKGDWYKIGVPKKKAIDSYEYFWFNKKYVKIDSSLEEDSLCYIFSSGGSNRSVEGDLEEDDESIAKMKVKTSGKVDLRKKHSLEGKSLGTIKSGKTVTLTGKWGEDNWHVRFFQVKYGKKTGYIAETYIRASDLKKINKNLPGE